MFIDTHSHIHDNEFFDEKLKYGLFDDAVSVGVKQVVCVGTDAKSSKQAVAYCRDRIGCFSSVALHPHDADHSEDELAVIRRLAAEPTANKVVAVGECGLDYYYENSKVETQRKVLVEHFEIAKSNSLPMIFHIRGSGANPDDAFSDFWEIYDQYKIPGIVHSFSAFPQQLEQILNRNLYVGINGIVTFAKDEQQKEAMLGVPLNRLVLETDSPFLSPVPLRGSPNTPSNIPVIAEFIADNRDLTVDAVAEATTRNAKELLGI